MSLETRLQAFAQSVGTDIKSILSTLAGKAEKIPLNPGDIVYGGIDGVPTLLPVGMLNQTLTIRPTNVLSWQDRLAGVDGISPTLSIGSVTTIASGLPATATFSGTTSNPILNLSIPRGEASVAVANIKLIAPTEVSIRVATAATGTINLDAGISGVYYYTTTQSTSNFIFNIRSTPTQTLNDMLLVGEIKVIVCVVLNGSNGYRPTAVRIDGVLISTPSIMWAGKAAPTVGTANGKDSYSLAITKVADNTWEILANQTIYG